MTSNNYPFKNQISELIRENGSAAVIARKIGISETTVGKWKKGDNDPSRENLLAICEAFDVNLLWLATGHGEKKKVDINEVNESSNSYTGAPKLTMDEVGDVMRKSWEKYEGAVKAADYRPNRAVEEHLKSLIFSASLKCSLELDALVSLLAALKDNSTND